MPRATPTTPNQSKSKIKHSSLKPYTKPSAKDSSFNPLHSTPDSLSSSNVQSNRESSRTSTNEIDRETVRLGQGYKDEAAALRTIKLVSKRSLLHQFQKVNAMYTCATHNSHRRGKPNIEAAIDIFKMWLDEVYPAVKASQMMFDRRTVKKDIVEKFLPTIQQTDKVDTTWTEMYIRLPKRTLLAKILMDERKPLEADMARFRQDHLEQLVNERASAGDGDDLWDETGVFPSIWHLKCIALAWSPVTDHRLARSFEA